VIVYCQAKAEDETFCHDWAESHDCVLIGPHSFGVQRPIGRLNASLHPTSARTGKVALIAQSRAIMSAVMDWADDSRTAFSAAVDMGDCPTVGVAALLDFFAFDRHTDSIVVYLDKIGNAREFMSALRAAASVKPVVVLRANQGQASDKDVSPDTVFEAALRRAGALRAHYFVQLFSTIKALSHLSRPRGRRLALFANGNGPIHLA